MHMPTHTYFWSCIPENDAILARGRKLCYLKWETVYEHFSVAYITCQESPLEFRSDKAFVRRSQHKST